MRLNKAFGNNGKVAKLLGEMAGERKPHLGDITAEVVVIKNADSGCLELDFRKTTEPTIKDIFHRLYSVLKGEESDEETKRIISDAINILLLETPVVNSSNRTEAVVKSSVVKK